MWRKGWKEGRGGREWRRVWKGTVVPPHLPGVNESEGRGDGDGDGRRGWEEGMRGTACVGETDSVDLGDLSVCMREIEKERERGERERVRERERERERERVCVCMW